MADEEKLEFKDKSGGPDQNLLPDLIGGEETRGKS